MLKEQKEVDPYFRYFERLSGGPRINEPSIGLKVDDNNATLIRNTFKHYFCGIGAIEQQWEKAMTNNF